MKIAILTLGTRGDVQPYAVLGQSLKSRGHQVTLVTARNFERFVKSYGLDFLPVEADFQEIINSDDGKKMLKGNPFAVRRNLVTWLYPLITDSLVQFYKLARESDLVLYHVKTLADSFADQLPHKMIRVSLLPMVESTSEFANPAFSGFSIPRFLNRITYLFSALSMKMLSKPIGKFRDSFKLPKLGRIPHVRNLYGISPYFLPKPRDYPKESKFLGFWLGSSQEELSQNLLDFIHAGEAPLVLTFGSMPFKGKFDLQAAILKLVETSKTRIIVVKGWGLEQTEKLNNHPRIQVIASAPFEKLFPLTKAVIHHGGIGTTAECLRAGKPFMICPILYPLGDQNFWGKLAYQKGLAVKPSPLSSLTEQIFLDRVSELLNTQSLYEKADQMSLLINRENGLQNAIDEIESIGNALKLNEP